MKYKIIFFFFLTITVFATTVFTDTKSFSINAPNRGYLTTPMQFQLVPKINVFPADLVYFNDTLVDYPGISDSLLVVCPSAEVGISFEGTVEYTTTQNIIYSDLEPPSLISGTATSQYMPFNAIDSHYYDVNIWPNCMYGGFWDYTQEPLGEFHIRQADIYTLTGYAGQYSSAVYPYFVPEFFIVKDGSPMTYSLSGNVATLSNIIVNSPMSISASFAAKNISYVELLNNEPPISLADPGFWGEVRCVEYERWTPYSSPMLQARLNIQPFDVNVHVNAELEYERTILIPSDYQINVTNTGITCIKVIDVTSEDVQVTPISGLNEEIDLNEKKSVIVHVERLQGGNIPPEIRINVTIATCSAVCGEIQVKTITTQPIRVNLGYPDLVTGILTDHTSYPFGSLFNFTVNVTSFYQSSSTSVIVYNGSDELTWDLTLTANSPQYKTYEARCYQPEMTLRVCADPNNNVNELFEDNNCFEQRITCGSEEVSCKWEPGLLVFYPGVRKEANLTCDGQPCPSPTLNYLPSEGGFDEYFNKTFDETEGKFYINATETIKNDAQFEVRAEAEKYVDDKLYVYRCSLNVKYKRPEGLGCRYYI